MSLIVLRGPKIELGSILTYSIKYPETLACLSCMVGWSSLLMIAFSQFLIPMVLKLKFKTTWYAGKIDLRFKSITQPIMEIIICEKIYVF